jgi:hypothetical protein
MLYPLSYGSGTPQSTDEDCGIQSIRTTSAEHRQPHATQTCPLRRCAVPGYGAFAKNANAGLRFLLELAMLASLGYYGFTQFNGVAA